MQVLPHVNVTLLVMLIHTLVTTVLENPFLISKNLFKLSWDFAMFNILGQEWGRCAATIHHIQTSSRQPTYQRSASDISYFQNVELAHGYCFCEDINSRLCPVIICKNLHWGWLCWQVMLYVVEPALMDSPRCLCLFLKEKIFLKQKTYFSQEVIYFKYLFSTCNVLH